MKIDVNPWTLLLFVSFAAAAFVVAVHLDRLIES